MAKVTNAGLSNAAAGEGEPGYMAPPKDAPEPAKPSKDSKASSRSRVKDE